MNKKRPNILAVWEKAEKLSRAILNTYTLLTDALAGNVDKTSDSLVWTDTV